MVPDFFETITNMINSYFTYKNNRESLTFEILKEFHEASTENFNYFCDYWMVEFVKLIYWKFVLLSMTKKNLANPNFILYLMKILADYIKYFDDRIEVAIIEKLLDCFINPDSQKSGRRLVLIQSSMRNLKWLKKILKSLIDPKEEVVTEAQTRVYIASHLKYLLYTSKLSREEQDEEYKKFIKFRDQLRDEKGKLNTLFKATTNQMERSQIEAQLSIIRMKENCWKSFTKFHNRLKSESLTITGGGLTNEALQALNVVLMGQLATRVLAEAVPSINDLFEEYGVHFESRYISNMAKDFAALLIKKEGMVQGSSPYLMLERECKVIKMFMEFMVRDIGLSELMIRLTELQKENIECMLSINMGEQFPPPPALVIQDSVYDSDCEIVTPLNADGNPVKVYRSNDRFDVNCVQVQVEQEKTEHPICVEDPTETADPKDHPISVDNKDPAEELHQKLTCEEVEHAVEDLLQLSKNNDTECELITEDTVKVPFEKSLLLGAIFKEHTIPPKNQCFDSDYGSEDFDQINQSSTPLTSNTKITKNSALIDSSNLVFANSSCHGSQDSVEMVQERYQTFSVGTEKVDKTPTEVIKRKAETSEAEKEHQTKRSKSILSLLDPVQCHEPITPNIENIENNSEKENSICSVSGAPSSTGDCDHLNVSTQKDKQLDSKHIVVADSYNSVIWFDDVYKNKAEKVDSYSSDSQDSTLVQPKRYLNMDNNKFVGEIPSPTQVSQESHNYNYEDTTGESISMLEAVLQIPVAPQNEQIQSDFTSPMNQDTQHTSNCYNSTVNRNNEQMIVAEEVVQQQSYGEFYPSFAMPTPHVNVNTIYDENMPSNMLPLNQPWIGFGEYQNMSLGYMETGALPQISSQQPDYRTNYYEEPMDIEEPQSKQNGDARNSKAKESKPKKKPKAKAPKMKYKRQ